MELNARHPIRNAHITHPHSPASAQGGECSCDCGACVTLVLADSIGPATVFDRTTSTTRSRPRSVFVRHPQSRRTRCRSLGVSPTAFIAHPPDLQFWPLMEMDFANACPLVRPVLPRIRFLFGDGEHAAIGSLAGGGQNDELGIGQLRHGFAPCVGEPRPSQPCPEPRRPGPDGATAERRRCDRIYALFIRPGKPSR